MSTILAPLATPEPPSATDPVLQPKNMLAETLLAMRIIMRAGHSKPAHVQQVEADLRELGVNIK